MHTGVANGVFRGVVGGILGNVLRGALVECGMVHLVIGGGKEAGCKEKDLKSRKHKLINE